MSERPPKPPELRINGLNVDEDKPKPVEKSRLRITGLNVGKETPKTADQILSGEELIGRILIQRDSGDRYRIFEYNSVKKLVRLEKLNDKTRITANLVFSHLLKNLQTEGGAWRLE